MALYSIENVGEWRDGGFTGALVTAANSNEAKQLIAEIVHDDDLANLKIERVSTAGAKRLYVGFND